MAGLFVVASSEQSLDTGGRCCGLMLEALGSDALVGDEGGSSCYVIRMGFCRTSRMSEEKHTANGNHVTQLSVRVCARV